MEVRYTAEHEWVAVEANIATIGITDYAQRVLGDLVFVQLPAVGSSLAKGAVAGVVESVKAASYRRGQSGHGGDSRTGQFRSDGSRVALQDRGWRPCRSGATAG